MRFVKVAEFDVILSTAEAAEALGVTSQTIRNLTQQGFLTPIKDYKEKGSKSAYYRLGALIPQYDNYHRFFKNKPLDGVSYENIEVIEWDVDPGTV